MTTITTPATRIAFFIDHLVNKLPEDDRSVYSARLEAAITSEDRLYAVKDDFDMGIIRAVLLGMDIEYQKPITKLKFWFDMLAKEYRIPFLPWDAAAEECREAAQHQFRNYNSPLTDLYMIGYAIARFRGFMDEETKTAYFTDMIESSARCFDPKLVADHLLLLLEQ